MRLTAARGRPRTLSGMRGRVGAWIVYNALAPGLRLRSLEPPPFYWLETTVGLIAILMTTPVRSKRFCRGPP